MRTDHKMANELVESYVSGGMSRREMLQKAGLMGLSVPVLTAALGARGAVAQSTPDASAAASPAADEAVTFGDFADRSMSISIAMAENEKAVFQEVVVNGFQEATGGTVEISDIEAADVVRSLEAQVGSGNIKLDMAVIDNNTLAPLVDRELVEPIEDAESIMPSSTIPALKDVLQFDGTYYFLPARPNVQITYYNSKKFEEYGVEPPKTWDDLAAVGKTIQEKAGVGQISIQGVAGGPVGVTVTQFLWQGGGDPLEINTPEGQAAFQFLQDLKPSLTPQYPTATFDTTNTYLLNESAVLAQNWPFGVVTIVKDGGKTEVLAYEGWEGPGGPGLVLGGDVLAIAKGSENYDMAIDFAKFWMQKDVQEQLTAKIGWAAMRDDALGAVEDWQQPYFEVVTKALAVTQPRPNVVYWTDVENVLTSAFNDIVSNGADVAETLDRYQEEINALKGE